MVYIPAKFFSHITPVNSFTIILNYYFDRKYELEEDRMYYSQPGTELNFSDVTEFLLNNKEKN